LAAVPVTARIAHKQLTRGRPGAARPAYNARPYIAWALDVFLSKDFVQYLDQRALAHSQTETGAAPWNREQLSEPHKIDNRAAA